VKSVGVTPRFQEQNRSLHTCAQDVQITRTTNNMVNKYNISIKLQAKILQNDPWVQNKDLQSSTENLRVGAASIDTTGGGAGLASFIFILLVPLTLIPTFNSM
jgi:hypothetical protein